MIDPLTMHVNFHHAPHTSTAVQRPQLLGLRMMTTNWRPIHISFKYIIATLPMTSHQQSSVRVSYSRRPTRRSADSAERRIIAVWTVLYGAEVGPVYRYYMPGSVSSSGESARDCALTRTCHTAQYTLHRCDKVWVLVVIIIIIIMIDIIIIRNNIRIKQSFFQNESWR